jgi:hypothetical protein
MNDKEMDEAIKRMMRKPRGADENDAPDMLTAEQVLRFLVTMKTKTKTTLPILTSPPEADDDGVMFTMPYRGGEFAPELLDPDVTVQYARFVRLKKQCLLPIIALDVDTNTRHIIVMVQRGGTTLLIDPDGKADVYVADLAALLHTHITASDAVLSRRPNDCAYWVLALCQLAIECPKRSTTALIKTLQNVPKRWLPRWSMVVTSSLK